MKKIWVVAAGTGGHIFPGLTLAQNIKEKREDIDFLFFGTKDRMESTLVPEYGFQIVHLLAPKWKGKGIISKLLIAPLSLLAGFFTALKTSVKNRPLALLSVGGYVSIPPGLVCALLRVPIFILEPNIKAGLANKFISRFATLAFTTPGSDAKKLFHCPVLDLGNPIRSRIKRVESLRPQVKKILVLGGSQGAWTLCENILSLCRKLQLAQQGIEVVLQSGEKNLDRARELKQELELGESISVVPFIKDIPEQLASSDLVVARAGAMSVAEITATGIPTIFVPYPYAADDHQRVNAKLLADDGAAIMVDERNENFSALLEEALEKLCLANDNLILRRSLHEGINRWSRPRAAQEIAERILSFC